MTCPHAGGDGRRNEGGETDDADGERGIDRRSFMKSALVIGGTSALATATTLYGVPETAAADSAVGVAERDNRQHAWDAYEHRARGTSVPPAHHLILHLDYEGSGTPTGAERRAVEVALRGLEESFEWGSEGLLFTIGYSKDYFDRYDRSLPGGLREGATRLFDPETTIDRTVAPHKDAEEIAADRYDAVLHLSSNDARKLLAAEAALWGEDTDLATLDRTFEGVFSKPASYPARRTGVAGHPYVEEAYDEAGLGDLADEIPKESELSMGFDALYGNSTPREELATMIEDQKLVDAAPPGVFAQGSIEHVSKLDVGLEDWYDNNSLDERRAQMLSPHHTEENTGTAGEKLGDSTAPESDLHMRNSDVDDWEFFEEHDVAERTVEDAREKGVVGHAQKLARARFDVEQRETGDPDYDPDRQRLESPLLRRDFDTTDQDTPGTHFVALMRFNGYMHYVRQAMNGTAFDTEAFALTGEDRIQHEDLVEETTGDDKAGFVNEDGEGNFDNGIVHYLTTQRRGNYLVPPIAIRGLPPARAVRPPIQTVVAPWSRYFGVLVSGTDDFDPRDLDLSTVRFGRPERVNRGRGARPVNVDDGDPTYGEHLDVSGDDLDSDQVLLVFPDEDADLSWHAERGRLFGKTVPSAGRVPVFGTDDDLRDFDLDDLEDDVESEVVTKRGTLIGGESDAYTYETRLETTRNVDVELEADGRGDLDLYVTVDGRTPTSGDYDRASRGWGSDEWVELPGARIADGGEIGILVDCYEGDVEYELVVSETGSD